MSDLDLLDRIKDNDPEAFLELTERYGWSVYSVLREKYADHTVVDKAYNETMNTFYYSIANSDTEDPLEAVLCAFASNTSHMLVPSQRNSTEHCTDQIPPVIYLRQQETKAERFVDKRQKKNSFWCHLSLFLAVAAIVVILWGILGLLMDMNLIPFYDLGYSWFHANVMQLF